MAGMAPATRFPAGWRGRLRAALQRFLEITPPAVSAVEEPRTSSRTAGFGPAGKHPLDVDTLDLADVTARGRAGYQDDLIDLPYQTRVQRVRLSRVLFERDARVRDIVRRTAAEVLRRGWSYSVPPEVPEAAANRLQAAMDEMVVRLDMVSQMRRLYEDALIDGDLFIQVVVGSAGVRRLQWLEPLVMQRVSNRHDLFPDPARAYVEYRDGTLVEDDSILKAMSAAMGLDDAESNHVYGLNEIVHARVGQRSGHRYGRPLLLGGLDSIRYARVGELDAAIRRKRKAAPQDVWVIGTPEHLPPDDNTRADVERMLQKRRANVEHGREIDPIVLYPVQPVHHPGDASVGVVGDVQHHLDTAYAAGPIPKQASGYMDDINRDVIPAVQAALRDNVESEREWLRDQLLVPTMRQALLWDGYPVEAGTITVTFPPQEYSLADFAQAAAALGNLAKGGLTTTDSTGRLLARLMPDVYDADTYPMEAAADREARRQEAAQAAANEETMA